VTAIGQALDEAAKFLQQFSKKGAFKKLCSGSLDARRFGLLDKRLCELSNELGSALDLQQLALQAQRFEKIEGLIQLLGQQTVDANNQAAAQRAAIMCGIQKGSAVEHEELSALGLKLDQIAADVSTVIDQNTKQQESLDEVKEMVAAKNSKLRGRALARQDKDRALEELEIELDSVEEKPIAKGSQGAVHKASYQGDVVALKKMSLVGICVEIKNSRRVRAESPRRPPRHRRAACSMAWRCRFLAARPSQKKAAPSLRGDLVKNCWVHPTHWFPHRSASRRRSGTR
jgi:hypothetical protein